MLGQGQVKLRAELDTTGVRRDMQRTGQEMTSGLGNVKQALNALGVTVGLYKVVQGLREASEMARKFEMDMANVYTLVGRESTVFGALDSRIMKLREDIPLVELNDLSAGLYNTISAGVDAEKSMLFMEGAAKAAAGGFAQVDSVVAGTAKILNAYNLEAEQTEYITDLGLKTVEKGIIRYDEYAHEISMIAGTAASAQVALEDLHAAIATATRVQLPAQAIVGLRQAIIELTKDPEKLREWNLEWNGILGVTEQLRARGMSDADWAELFPNIRAAETMKVLYNNYEGLVEINEDFGDVAGTTAEKFEIAMDSDAAAIARAEAKVESIKMKIGVELNEAVASFAEGSEEAFDELNEELDALEKGFGVELPESVRESINEFNLFSDALFPVVGIFENLGKVLVELYKDGGIIDKGRDKMRDWWQEKYDWMAEKGLAVPRQRKGGRGGGRYEGWGWEPIAGDADALKPIGTVGEAPSDLRAWVDARVAAGMDEESILFEARGHRAYDKVEAMLAYTAPERKKAGKKGKAGRPRAKGERVRLEKGLGGVDVLPPEELYWAETELDQEQRRKAGADRDKERDEKRAAEIEAQYEEMVAKVQGIGDLFGSTAASALWMEGEEVAEQLGKTVVNTIVSELVGYLVVQGIIALLQGLGLPIPGFQHGGRSDRPAIFGEGPVAEWAIQESASGLRMFLMETLPAIIGQEPALRGRARGGEGDGRGLNIYVGDVDRTGLAFAERAQHGAVSAGARRL